MGDPPSVRVFISYRREDTAGYAGRLYDALAARMGAHDVFMDVSDIEPGVDFSVAIADAVGSCDVMLALIGTRWATAVTPEGTRRLDDPDDYVVVETAAALERDVRVIPVLVEGASMPGADTLPERLRALARRNAVQLSTVTWRTDVERLVAALQRLPPRSAAPEAPASADLAPSAGARAGATPIEPVAPGAGHPRRRRRLVWGAIAAAVAAVLVAVPLALADSGSPPPLVESEAKFGIVPTSGPPGTPIEIEGEPCPALPDGWETGGITVGLSGDSTAEHDLRVDPGASWHDQLRVPDEAPSRPGYAVWAQCWADDPDGDNVEGPFYNYPQKRFEVTAP